MFSKKPDLNIIEESTFEELSKPCQKLVVKAEKGNFKSLVTVAKGFIYGKDDFPINPNLGLRYLQFGAEKDDTESLKLYGRYLLQGEIIDKNEMEAINILNSAATKTKNAAVKLELAEILLANQSFDVNSYANNNINYPLVKQLYKDAADYGNLDGITNYAKFCLKEKTNRYGSIERDIAEAFNYFKTAAELGDSEAMIRYGRMLECGIPQFPVNQKEAIKWYKRSYEKENLGGYAEYGYTLISSEYGKTDEPEGYRLIKYSSDHGNPIGMFCYGNIYCVGMLCVQQDYQKGFELVKKAADMGEPGAIQAIGFYYQEGIYVQKNTITANKYFKLALEEGKIASAVYLGYAYKNSGNSSQSRIYFKIGADAGFRDAIYEYCLNLSEDNQKLLYIYEIRKYLEMGRKLKDGQCILFHGNLYIKGDLFPQKKYLGEEFVKEAADNGYIPAMERFIDMYEKGTDGFTGNPPEVQKYKDILAENQSQCCLLI